MLSCKVHIAVELVEGPYGGSHQFLKALRNRLRHKGVYSEILGEADVLLIDSFQFLQQVVEAKSLKPEITIVHRIDGPIRLYNSMSDFRDIVINTTNYFLADATIFQSSWSQKENYRLGLKPTIFEAVVPNAPDPLIFNEIGRKEFSKNDKGRLIAVSWSSNWKKGFKSYQWLDENLDFSKYDMTFIGNSPVTFKNIKHLPPMDSKELADQLRKHDILIFASEFEACSNTLLEALHCGLPVVAKNATSNPSVMKMGGELFDQPKDIPVLLERIFSLYYEYQQRIQILTLDEVVEQYYSFFLEIYEANKTGCYKPKSFNYLSRVCLLGILKWWKIRDRIIGRLSRAC